MQMLIVKTECVVLHDASSYRTHRFGRGERWLVVGARRRRVSSPLITGRSFLLRYALRWRWLGRLHDGCLLFLTFAADFSQVR